MSPRYRVWVWDIWIYALCVGMTKGDHLEPVGVCLISGCCLCLEVGRGRQCTVSNVGVDLLTAWQQTVVTPLLMHLSCYSLV